MQRDSRNANSAMIVTVTPEDFGSDDILAGVEFQRKLERAAYELGGGKSSGAVVRRIIVRIYRQPRWERWSLASRDSTRLPM